RLGFAVAIAAGHAHNDLGGLFARGGRRRGPGCPFQSMALPRIFALSLRGDPAGNADRRHRAAPAHLPAAARGGFDMRLDRGVLSGAGEYHAWIALGGPQSHGPLFALRRLARAGAVAPEAAVGAALYSRGATHRRGAVADRRGGR